MIQIKTRCSRRRQTSPQCRHMAYWTKQRCLWFWPIYFTTVYCRHVSVCLSVTSQHCTKTAKHRITQTTPYDCPRTL